MLPFNFDNISDNKWEKLLFAIIAIGAIVYMTFFSLIFADSFKYKKAKDAGQIVTLEKVETVDNINIYIDKNTGVKYTLNPYNGE